MFVWSVRDLDTSAVDYVGIKGNLGAGGQGSRVQYDLTVLGHRVLVNSVSGTPDASVIHVWIFPCSPPGLGQVIPIASTDSNGDQILNPGPNFDFLLVSNDVATKGVNSAHVTESEIINLVTDYLQNFSPNESFCGNGELSNPFDAVCL